MDQHQEFMAEAIRLADTNLDRGDGGPFGAVVVLDGRIIGRGWNRVLADCDPSAHAEVVAIRDACRQLSNYHLTGASLYVNCEPCPMCFAAAYWAEISSICYGANRDDAAAIGFADAKIYRQLGLPAEQRELKSHRCLRDEAVAGFARWQALASKIIY